MEQMKKRTRILSLLLIAALTVTGMDLTAFAEESVSSGNVVTIKNEADWNALAKKCKSNTYSQGLTVQLKKDLTLSKDAKVIPYFAGTFAGNGYEITGEGIRREESDLALFSETGETAVISDLSVSVEIMADAGQENVGGIVETNRGIIIGCSFVGIVSGDKNVGGIAGINDTNGQIIDCSASGVITGENKTGGITGYNQGTIYRCSNEAAVNISVSDESAQLSSVEETFYKIWKDENLEDMVPSTSDTGGICGYSTGIITECSNSGLVGYAHVGYNVGGIAGRQCGYVGNCQNTGNIQGRKDVGGIIGQAVPDVTIIYGEDTIANMRSALKKLQSLMKQTTQDADHASKTVSNRLDQVSSYVDVATDSADKIYDQVDDNVTTNTDTINDTSAKTKSYIRRMKNVTSKISDASDKMENAGNTLEDWYKDYRDQIGDLQEADDATQALVQVQASANTLVQTYALDDLDWSNIANWTDDDWQALADELSKLEDALNILADAVRDDRLETAIDELKDASSMMSDAADEADGIIKDIDAEDEVSIKQFDDDFDAETDRLHGALRGISDQLSLLNKEMSGESDKLIDDMNSVSDQFSVLMDLFIDALSDMQDFDVDDIYVDASDEEIASTIQGKITGCTNHGLVEGDVNTGGVVGTMAIEYADDPEDDLDEARENNFNITYQTKVIVENCSNDAEVVGKKNCVGSVVGRMDIGVITGCQGSGIVHSTTGDYIGGVCGYALSGIRNSQSKAILAGRDYVGGIAGISSDAMTNCTSMVTIVSHERYAAAIAGDVDDVTEVANCYYVSDVLSGIDRIDYAGIAEEISYDQLKALTEGTDCYTNFTVIFRLDDRLENAQDTDAENKDQILVDTRTCAYGDQIKASDYPTVEEQAGYYVAWDQEDVSVQGLTVISGKYVAYDTLLESSAKDADGRPVLLVEGQFKDSDTLYVEDLCKADGSNAKALAKEAGGILSGIRYKELVAEYAVTLPDDGVKKHVIWIRMEDPDKKYSVLVKKNGTWKAVDAETSGHHLLVPVSVSQVEIAVMEKRF